MSTVEDRARDALHQLAEPVDSGLTLDQVFDAGRRRRRQRRFAVMTSAAAGALVVVLTVALLPGAIGRAPISATPAPITSPTSPASGSPAPTGSPTAAATSYDVGVDLGSSIYADLDYGLSSLTGTATRSAQGWQVTFDAVTKAGAKIHRTSQATSAVPAVARITDRVWVVISPTATWLTGVLAGGGVAMEEDATTQSLPFSVYLLATGNVTGKLAGFVWKDATGAAFDERGAPVPTADFSFAGGTAWFLRDSARKIACGGDTSDQAGAGCDVVGTPKSSGIIALAYGDGAIPRDGSRATYRAVQFGVLPVGATALDIRPAFSGCVTATSAFGTTGATAFLISCSREWDGKPLYARISYTDASGMPKTLLP